MEVGWRVWELSNEGSFYLIMPVIIWINTGPKVPDLFNIHVLYTEQSKVLKEVRVRPIQISGVDVSNFEMKREIWTVM